MEITKKKHKQTEMGVIPYDWEIKEFQDVLTGFFSGATPYRGRPEYYKGEIYWISSGELNYNIITDTLEKITEQAVKNTNLKILPKGTFLFAITGLEAEGTRGSCGITGVEATTNQSCMALFPKETLDSNYLYHFYVWQGKMLALKYCQGTKQQSYTAKIARTLPIILPPTKSEQIAIATALSDVDALIENLEKLIAKKRNIKQGVMQKLLSGESRLTGFHDIWDKKTLGELIDDIADGGTPPTSNSKYFGGDINWVVIEDIKDEIYTTKDTLTKLGLSKCSSRLWKPETIILSTGATIGVVGITKVNTATKQGICGIVLKENYCNKYLKFWFELNKNLLLSKAQGSSIREIRPPTIKKLPISIPRLVEQNAIANVISELEGEIKSLEKRLFKFRMIKQAMMQALLTGKIRLI